MITSSEIEKRIQATKKEFVVNLLKDNKIDTSEIQYLNNIDDINFILFDKGYRIAQRFISDDATTYMLYKLEMVDSATVSVDFEASAKVTKE